MHPDKQTQAATPPSGTPASDPGSNPDESVPVVHIPDHTLLRRIGGGSYGQVWLARNMMGIYRAVKVVHRRNFKDERPFERELSGFRKFEPISRSHEGFVDILQVGRNEEEGYFYYVMELGDDEVSGQQIDPDRYAVRTLAGELRTNGKLPLTDCLHLGLALSQALAELHRHGLVHRDVKPSNIIFVHGVPKLADIGLVADIADARSYVGTDGFIPPEGPGAATADIYGLGKTLYEASTGKDRMEFPGLPADWDKFPDHDGLVELNAVILRACQANLSNRYRSASDLRRDLLVVTAGKSVTRLQSLERLVARTKRGVGLAILILAVLAVIVIPSYRARTLTQETRRLRVAERLAAGDQAVAVGGDLTAELAYFTDAWRFDRGNSEREAWHRLRIGTLLPQCPRVVLGLPGSRPVRQVELSDDGRRALITHRLGKAELFDLGTGRKIPLPDQLPWVVGASLSPDGHKVAASLDTKNQSQSQVAVWDLDSLNNSFILDHTTRVIEVKFSPGGKRLVTAGSDGVARVFDLADTNRVLRLQPSKDMLNTAEFSADGTMIVTASRDNFATILDATTGTRIGEPMRHPNWVMSAAFSPDGTRIVTTCFDNKVRVWEINGDRKHCQTIKHEHTVWEARFSPDGRFIVSVCSDHSAHLWYADSLAPASLNPLLRHNDLVLSAVFSTSGRQLLTGCRDGSAWLWDLAAGSSTGFPTSDSYSHDGTRSVAFTNGNAEVTETAATSLKPSQPIPLAPSDQAELNRNGRFLIISSSGPNGGSENSVRVCDSRDGTLLGPPIRSDALFSKLVLSDDGRCLIASGGNQAQAWDVRAGKPFSEAKKFEYPVSFIAITRDGERFTTSSTNEVRIWKTRDGTQVGAALIHELLADFVEFSPDGTRFVSCCWNTRIDKGYAQVWDAATGKPIGHRLNHSDGVLRASFSPDGSRVATASEDHTAIVWDATTGAQLTRPLKHQNYVYAATFSPDGHRIATASADHTARVWFIDDGGSPLTPPLQCLDDVKDVIFLPDGIHLVTMLRNGDNLVWNPSAYGGSFENLAELVRFLSGDLVTAPSSASSSNEEFPEETWQRLRAKFAKFFEVSDHDIFAWHKFQALDAEADDQWSAAEFHIKILLAQNPASPSLPRWLDLVGKHLHGGANDKAAAGSR